MAWTHYTAPLAAGEELTAAMRRELWEALEERRALMWPSSEIDFGYLDTLEAAGLDSARIRVRNLVDPGWVVSSLHVVLSALARRTGDAFAPFKKDTTTANLSWTTESDWQADVAAVIGLSSSALGLVWAQSRGLASRHYWNSIRAGITLLKHVRFGTGGTALSTIQIGSDSTPPITIAGAVAAWPAFYDENIATYEFVQCAVESYVAVVFASATSPGRAAVLPDLPCVDGMVVRYNLRIQIDASAPVAAPVASLPVSISLGPYDGGATSTGGANEIHAVDFNLAASDRGATLPFRLRFRAYDTPSDFLAFEALGLSGGAYATALVGGMPEKATGVATPAFQYA